MPTLNEVPAVAKLLATILTAEPVTHGALAVIPLLAPTRAWPRLCAGYVADAIGREPKPWHRLDAGAVLEALAQTQAEPVPAVGLGEEYRLSTPGLAGATLVAQGQVAHLMAFPVNQ